MYPPNATTACVASAADRPMASPSRTRLPVITLANTSPSRVKHATSVAPAARVSVTARTVIAVAWRWPSRRASPSGCLAWPSASSVAGTVPPHPALALPPDQGSDMQDQPVRRGLEAGLVQMVQHVIRHMGEHGAPTGQLAAVSGQVRVPQVVGDDLVAIVGLRDQQVRPGC